MLAKRRVILVDHMCALPYGHNVRSVDLFRRMLSPFFEKSLCLVSRYLPKEIAREKNFQAELYYPYHAIIPIRFGRLVSRLKSPVAQRDARRILVDLEKRLLYLSNEIWNRDTLLPKVRRNWKRVIKAHGIGGDDLIFFPSADYYGAATLLQILAEQKGERPDVHCHFIGVMEDASLFSVTARTNLLRAMEAAEKSGMRVSASAEVPIYARYLASVLGKEVFPLLYPLVGERLPMPRGTPFLASSIGQGRPDKGHFEMAAIADALQRSLGSRVSMEIQDMGKVLEDYRYSYERELGVFPNVRLRPAVLKEEELLDMFRRAYVVLAPYDPINYRMRGSAIFQEAVALGRPIITHRGVGFAELIEKYECGYLCTGARGIADAVRACIAISPETWEARMENARQAYARDIQAGRDTLLRMHS